MLIGNAVAKRTAQTVREDTCKLSGSLIMKKRVSLVRLSRATVVHVMCSRLSGIQISSRLIALSHR